MKTRNSFVVALVSAMTLVMSAMPVSAAPHATVKGTYLDDFTRTFVNGAALEPPDVQGDKIDLSDSLIQIYWNMHYNGVFTIKDSVLIAKCNNGGCYRFATSSGQRFSYVVVRMKGDAKAANNLIYFRIASQGATDSGGISDASKGGVSERMLDSLVDPDSANMPEISDQFQLFVVDLAKNGLHYGDVGGSNAFQFGTHAAMELDIDYIFATNFNPNAANPVVYPKSVNSKKAVASQVNVWATGPSRIMVTMANAASGTFSLYNLQGKLARSFNIQGRKSEVNLSGKGLGSNAYLYTVNGLSGDVLAKGKIILR
jgi:hypothetical protein